MRAGNEADDGTDTGGEQLAVDADRETVNGFEYDDACNTCDDDRVRAALHFSFQFWLSFLLVSESYAIFLQMSTMRYFPADRSACASV
jgi:hypothetical protein